MIKKTSILALLVLSFATLTGCANNFGPGRATVANGSGAKATGDKQDVSENQNRDEQLRLANERAKLAEERAELERQKREFTEQQLQQERQNSGEMRGASETTQSASVLPPIPVSAPVRSRSSHHAGSRVWVEPADEDAEDCECSCTCPDDEDDPPSV